MLCVIHFLSCINVSVTAEQTISPKTRYTMRMKNSNPLSYNTDDRILQLTLLPTLQARKFQGVKGKCPALQHSFIYPCMHCFVCCSPKILKPKANRMKLTLGPKKKCAAAIAPTPMPPLPELPRPDTTSTPKHSAGTFTFSNIIFILRSYMYCLAFL